MKQRGNAQRKSEIRAIDLRRRTACMRRGAFALSAWRPCRAGASRPQAGGAGRRAYSTSLYRMAPVRPHGDKRDPQGAGTRPHHDRSRRQQDQPIGICRSQTDGLYSTTSTSMTGGGDGCSCASVRFSARVCLNQHHWLANRMSEEGIDFRQCANAFIRCSTPERLQQLADSLDPRELSTCGQKWLARLTPSLRERGGDAGHRHSPGPRFDGDNPIRRRAALDKLGERLLDANRTIGQPNKITMIFGRRISRHHRGKLQTEIEDMNLPNPVIRSHYGNGFIKQYVRDHLILRTEPASNIATTMM